MKKIILGSATVLFFFISCNDSATTSTATTETSQTEKNLANNRKVLKAIETGDAGPIDSLIADDALDHQGPNGTDIKGDSIRLMLKDMHNHVKDLKIDVISDAANGDYIFSLSNMSGTTSDAWMGMPAGMKMDEKGVDVVKIKDGKMVEHWGFVDPAAMMKHMKEMPMGKMDEKMDGKMDKMNEKMDTGKMKK